MRVIHAWFGKIDALYLLDCCCVRACVSLCVCVCGHMLDTYKVFSPPYCSSFKFEFALENLLGVP